MDSGSLSNTYMEVKFPWLSMANKLFAYKWRLMLRTLNYNYNLNLYSALTSGNRRFLYAG